ncbi:uncharacterized protein DS421_2g49530 [Arachis hypogaea]|nr:uncharacterized protein DS421_2g49530 [Arachis hypogaea]
MLEKVLTVTGSKISERLVLCSSALRIWKDKFLPLHITEFGSFKTRTKGYGLSWKCFTRCSTSNCWT